MAKKRIFPFDSAKIFFNKKIKKELGFTLMLAKEVSGHVKNLPESLQKPKTGKNVEICYKFSEGYFTILILTAVIQKLKGSREKDSARVLIIDQRFPLEISFFSFGVDPLAKNYLYTLYRLAGAFKELICNLPSRCWCGEDLRIKLVERGRISQSTFTCCKKTHLVSGKDRHIFQGLTRENKKFLVDHFKDFYVYPMKSFKKGKSHNHFRVILPRKKVKERTP